MSVVISKPNKNVYNATKAFWLIVLFNTTSKLIEKVISNWFQFHISANGFLDFNQLEGIRQCSTIDAGLYLTYIIYTGWIKQCYTSITAFNTTQFFSFFNHFFLSTCLKKVGLNNNIVKFFKSYHYNQLTTYTWNSFTSLPLNSSISIGQGLALFPILSTIYMAPIMKTFKKRIKKTY